MKDVTIQEVVVSLTKTYIIKLRVESGIDKEELMDKANYHILKNAEEFEMSPLSLSDKDEIEVLEILDEWNDYED
jgi:hypothetical protein